MEISNELAANIQQFAELHYELGRSISALIAPFVSTAEPEINPESHCLNITRIGEAVVGELGLRIYSSFDLKDELNEAFTALQGQNHPQLILNFGKVEYLNVDVLGTLIRLNKHQKSCGHRLILCGIKPGSQIMEIFRQASILSLFEFKTDLPAALAALGTTEPPRREEDHPTEWLTPDV